MSREGSYIFDEAIDAFRNRSLDWEQDEIMCRLLADGPFDAEKPEAEMFIAEPAPMTRRMTRRRELNRTCYCFDQTKFQDVTPGRGVYGLLIYRASDRLPIAQVQVKKFLTNGGEVIIFWNRTGHGVLTLTEEEIGREAI